MKNKFFILSLSAGLILGLSACSTSPMDQAKSLMSNEDYLEASEILKGMDNSENEIDQSGINEMKTICNYQLGKEAFYSQDYKAAISYLESIDYEDSKDLLASAKKKISVEELMNDIGQAIDARYAKVEELKNSILPEAYHNYISSELDILKKYKDSLDVGNLELEKAVQNLISADEEALTYVDQMNENLNKNWLNYMAANGDRIEALVTINEINTIPLNLQMSKDQLNSYKEIVSNGTPQRIYKTLNITEKDFSFGTHFYTIEGENNTDQTFKDFWFYFEILDSEGNLIGHLMSQTISELRPGQKFIISANTNQGDQVGSIENTMLQAA